MIRSLLDTDFYKFTMMQAVLHNYPGAMVRYEFKWRNWDQMQLRISVKDFMARLKRRLDDLCKLRFTEEEILYLNSIPFFKKDFIEYLKLFRLNRSHIRCQVVNDEPKITVEGPWLATILFEVPVLATVSQLYTENGPAIGAEWQLEGRKRRENKFSMLEAGLHKDMPFVFADFGTRRRATFGFQEETVQFILEKYNKFFVGTSNVYLAMKYGIKPIGTMAHEWLQMHQQLGPRLVDSQSAALQTWANEYRGELGIALSDCLGFRMFLKDFDRYFGLLFDGCRHDSGDPVWWCENLIDHYKGLRIDPKTKSAVFSDGLNFELAIDLFRRFHTEINVSFGIGTYLTNDCGFTAPQIVMKVVECNGKPVAKISDSAGKGMCEDPEFLEYLRKVVKER
jgi:nicotinate phosphoribosyltransferase